MSLESWWVRGTIPKWPNNSAWNTQMFAQICIMVRGSKTADFFRLLNHQQVCGNVDFYSGSMSHLLRKMTLWKIFIMFIHVHYIRGFPLWALHLSPPARWGSLDFNKGATPFPPYPPTPLSCGPLIFFISSGSCWCCGPRLYLNTTSPAPDAAGPNTCQRECQT